MLVRVLPLVAVLALLVAACGGGDSADPSAQVADSPTATVGDDAPASGESGFADGSPGAAAADVPDGSAPVAPSGPLDPVVATTVEDLFANIADTIDREAITSIGESGDPRLAWLLTDLLRFVPASDLGDALVTGVVNLTGMSLAESDRNPTRAWLAISNQLIAWDVPAPPNYRRHKGQLYTALEPAWKSFFADEDAAIDWRWVTWGGVLIDDRELGDPNACLRGCIPSLDDPAVTRVRGGSWYADDAIVFGVVVNGEARAYPKHIMEIHEMVNDTLGGRRIGMPYCTLCGSAQAYFTDGQEGEIVLRTSGLLSRSNKVMYDLRSRSVFDTFTGEALSGPLQDEGLVLEQLTVTTSTWGEWKAAHPETTIVAEDGGIGRVYPLDPLGGRDDRGPIFPVGDVDPRLAAHDRVVGVIAPDGTPLAFPTVAVRVALEAGGVIELHGVLLEANDGGFRALDFDGMELVAHESFWFAWSQFMPGTELWVSVAP